MLVDYYVDGEKVFSHANVGCVPNIGETIIDKPTGKMYKVRNRQFVRESNYEQMVIIAMSPAGQISNHKEWSKSIE